MLEWESYIPKDWQISYAPGSLVLDVGCGHGDQMKLLCQQGCLVIGIDVGVNALLQCQKQGLSVLRACAEHIPIKAAGIDGVLCKVVLPYTREQLVIREIGRILKSQGKCYLISHGGGYYLRYILSLAPSWKQRFYGLRSLVNTWFWIVTGRILPGFLGDTIYQSRRRLERYFQENGLHLMQDTVSRRFLGFPVFLYQVIEKVSHVDDWMR